MVKMRFCLINGTYVDIIAYDNLFSTWLAKGNDFVVGYESGMTMVEIAKRNNVSERTIYRYKAYYDKMKKIEE